MHIFQTNRKLLKMFGVEPTQSTRLTSFNGKLTLGFLFVALSIILSALYLVYLAKTVMEFIQCFCLICTMSISGFSFAAIVLQNERFYNYIEKIEVLINRSKLCLPEIKSNI